MPFSYKPLWKKLIDKNMTKKALMSVTHISKSTMDKMGRGQPVSMDIIDRVCEAMDCPISDVIEYIKEE
jgi:Predicted transcriptional regulator